MEIFSPWSMYDQQSLLLSSGRIPLTAAFVDVVMLNIGFERHEFSDIFAAPHDNGENDIARAMMCGQAHMVASHFVSGRIPTFARPFGGGEVILMPAHYWEIDDPMLRFAFGALNLEHWANADAAPTHTIFVDRDTFNAWFAALQPNGPLTKRQLDDVMNPQARAKRAIAAQVRAIAPAAQMVGSLTQPRADPPGVGPMFIKLAEVMEMVSLSKSTIHTKISEGAFPKQVKMGSSSRWYRDEIVDWMAQHAVARSTPMY
jgi:predicted DNA-binding transcriptional regulator AlpA